MRVAGCQGLFYCSSRQLVCPLILILFGLLDHSHAQTYHDFGLCCLLWLQFCVMSVFRFTFMDCYVHLHFIQYVMIYSMSQFGRKHYCNFHCITASGVVYVICSYMPCISFFKHFRIPTKAQGYATIWFCEVWTIGASAFREHPSEASAADDTNINVTKYADALFQGFSMFLSKGHWVRRFKKIWSHRPEK